jgi:ArsR family transcriptional regulator
MNTVASTVNTLQLFGEPSRVRLLALLANEELSVAELTAATRLAQSRVSTHLGKLREAGVLRDRRDGHSTYYSLNDGAMPPEAKRLWGAIQPGIKDALLEGDRERCAKVLRARAKGTAWADAVAGEMERHYSPGRTWESLARGLLALGRFGDVLDVGCGDGSVAQLVLARAKSVTCVDRSEKMIAAARKRLGRGESARCVLADAESLPFGEGSFDQVLLFNLLSCVASPAKVVREAARVLRPGGEVAVSVVGAHAHTAVTAEYGHVHPGFAPAAVKRMLVAAGLTVTSCAITSREKRAPHFDVVTASAAKTGKD